MVVVEEHERKIPAGGPWTIYDSDSKGTYDYKIFSKNSNKFVEFSTEFESGDMVSVSIESHVYITSCAHLTIYITNGTYIIPMQWSAPEQYLENYKKLLL